MSSNVKGHGRVPYQKPWLKSMVHGVHPRIAECISAMHGTNSHEQSLVPKLLIMTTHNYEIVNINIMGGALHIQLCSAFSGGS